MWKHLIQLKLEKEVEIATNSDYNENVETFQSAVYKRN